jgi:uncharacterized protein (DUF2235 family)
MKNIAIFCDGTWQHLDQRYPTNVAKLARAVAPAAADGSPQVILYDDGVGVSQSPLDLSGHLLGGAIGEGLDYKIASAYEFLCLNYQPGDRIFLFGFSRGAYTARSLAGLLRWAWILRREHACEIFEATARYRMRPKKDAPPQEQAEFEAMMKDFRDQRSYPSNVFTDDKPYDPASPDSLTPNNKDCAWLQYVGVWDTVGSLGVPRTLPLATQVNARYGFYDTSLSRFVRSARHAVSLDERRVTFEPTLWDNIPALNVNAHADGLAPSLRPYQQTWFPGGHGEVGGGGDDGGLSLIPMLWVAEGGARAGLAFNTAELQDYARIAHPDARIQKGGLTIGLVVTTLTGLMDRDGPDLMDDVSLSACLRWNRMADYRPASLRRAAGLADQLDRFAPQADPQVFYAP